MIIVNEEKRGKSILGRKGGREVDGWSVTHGTLGHLHCLHELIADDTHPWHHSMSSSGCDENAGHWWEGVRDIVDISHNPRSTLIPWKIRKILFLICWSPSDIEKWDERNNMVNRNESQVAQLWEQREHRNKLCTGEGISDRGRGWIAQMELQRGTCDL